MDFEKLVVERSSCRKFDSERSVEPELLQKILESARLAPSACNGQPYHITVCTGKAKDAVAKATQGPGINGFVSSAPLLLVISEKSYVRTAAIGAKVKHNDYRSIDIGILASHVTLQASELGLGSCILGWLSDEEIRKICGLDQSVRLVIAIGYPASDFSPRPKKRKELSELVDYLDQSL